MTVLRALLALAVLWFAGAGGAAAARVDMLYLGTDDCRYCRTWEAQSRAALLDSPEGRAIRFVEVRGETLRKPIVLEHYPAGYEWAFGQVGPSRGVPRFILFVDGKLVLSVYGLTAYERDFLPALKSLVARPATSARRIVQRRAT